MKKRTAWLAALLAAALCFSPALSFAANASAAPTEDWLELNVATQEEADVLYERYADSFNGGDVRLIISGDKDVFIPFLLRFSFRSLALNTQYIETGSGESICDISGIEEVVCPYGCVGVRLPGIKKLTAFAESDYAATLSLARFFYYAPDLETLTLRFSSGWWSGKFSLGRGMIVPRGLQTVEVTVDDAPEILPADSMAYFIAALQYARQEVTLNGAPVTQWQASQELGDDARNAIEQLPNDTALCALFKRYADGEDTSSGSPAFGEKLVVMIYYGNYGSGELKTSLDASAVGNDYYGLPASRMARTLEEADTAIILFKKNTRVGMYTNGLPANGTDTMVGIVDLASGTMYKPYSAVYSSPPKSITMMGGGHGDFLPETALQGLSQKLR